MNRTESQKGDFSFVREAVECNSRTPRTVDQVNLAGRFANDLKNPCWAAACRNDS